MGVQTVAQLLAVVSADISPLNTRLTEVEEKLKKSEQQFNSLAAVVDKSMSAAAASTGKATNAIKEQQRAADNLAKFEYQTNQKSGQDYQTYLRKRITETASATSEYTRLTNQYVQVERKAQSEIEAASKKASSEKVAAAKKANDEVLQSEQRNLQVILSDLKVQEQAEKTLQTTREQTAKNAQIAADQQKAAAASLARFEYEQGNLSAEAYKVFLERRMASYAEYSQEWKTAASQLVQVDREIEGQKVEAANQAQDEILARQKEIASQRIAVEKEVNAEMTAWDKEYVAGFVAQMDEAAAAQAASREKAAHTRSTVGNGLGGVAAGIGAVELGSAILASNFDHTQTGIANNTLMTNYDIKQMRETTLKLARDTGAPLEDLAKGYMHITNFGANAKDAVKELTIANKEAVATMSSTSDVSNALATSLHIFGANAGQAAGYMDVLHHAAAAGNLTVEDFVASSGKALAISAEMKDKFYDAAAAMSLLSRSGFDAAQAATQIQSLVAHIADPADKATKNIHALQTAFHAMNPKSDINLMYDFSQPGIQAKGLLGIMKDLYLVTHGNASEIAALLPALRGGVGGTALTQLFGKDNGKEVNETLAALKKLQTANTGQETESIYGRMMKDSGQKFKQFTMQLQTDFIPIGEKAIKIFMGFEPGIVRLANITISLMTAFQKLPVPIQEAVTAIGGLFILEKFTGILAALRVPMAFSAGLQGMIRLTKALSVEEGVLTLAEAAQVSGLSALGTTLTGLAASTGPFALVVIAVAALVTELYFLKQSYDSMKESQDQAATSAKNFANMQTHVATQGEKGALETESQKIGIAISARQTAISTYQQDKIDQGKAGYSGPHGAEIDSLIAKAKSDIAGFQVSYKTEMSRLHILNKTGTGNGPSDIFSPGTIGAKAALAADVEASNTAAHDCQHRARVIIQSTTHAFDKMFSATNRVGQVTAKAVAEEGAREGLMQPYRPGMTLKPGDLLYSTTLAKSGAGHVQAVDSKGNRRDQYGSNHFNESNFQYLFDPDYAASIQKNGGGGTTPVSSGSNTNAVSPEALAASVASEKERAAQLKAAAKAAKELDNSYKSHYASLLKIAAVGEATVDKNAPSTKYQTGVASETAEGGALYGISSSERANLMGAARRADAALDLRKALEEREKVAKAYQKELEKIADKVKVAVLDLEYAPKLDAPGNEALKSAVAQEGGIQEWMKLGVKPSDVGPRRPDGRSDAQSALIQVQQIKEAADYEKQIREITAAQKDEQASFNDNNKKSVDYDARAEAIDKFNLSHAKLIEGINLEADATLKLKHLQALDVARAAAGDEGNNENIITHANSLDALTAGNNAKEQESLLSLQKLTMTVGDYAVAQWKASAAGQEMIRTLGEQSDKVIAYEQSLRNVTGQESNTAGQLQQQGLMNDITKQSLDLHASNPFDAWLKSFYVLQATIGANGQTVMGYILPNGMNVADMKKIYDMQLQLAQVQKAQEMKKQAIEGLSTGIMSGVMSAFSPNPQATGNLQSQLLQQQQEQMQYKVAEAQFKSQYPGDPNDPYIQRLQLIQQQIDKTKQKLNDMGNNLGSTFKRLFGGIYDSFVQSLQKMAQSYLQSALLGYLTKQIGSGQGPVSGQGSGGFLGGIAGLIGTGLNLFGGKSLGAAASSTASIMSVSSAALPSISSVTGISPILQFAKGGHFDGSAPIMVGDGGEPEIIVPDAPGTVIPMSKAQSTTAGRAAMGNQTIVHQKLTQNITTPDVQGFRSSRATQKQGVRRLMRQM